MRNGKDRLMSNWTYKTGRKMFVSTVKRQKAAKKAKRKAAQAARRRNRG